MKNYFIILFVLNCCCNSLLYAQPSVNTKEKNAAIIALIDQYSIAREKRDTVLLKNILTSDIDQLVSSGEWRMGIHEAVQGMLKSSATTPGTRTLTVDRLKFLDANNAVADARYEIKNDDGTLRKMWSTFIVVLKNGQWRIAGIRNMLPAAL